VLLGGLSSERAVSLKSGHAVADALREIGYEVVELDADREIDRRIRESAIDVAFPVLHGRWGEDGCIQGLLEYLGVPYCGPSVFAAALTMDKEFTRTVLDQHGVPVPRGRTLRRVEDVSGIAVPGPWVVKPVREGSSFGVTMVDDALELPAAVAAALALDDRALVEERIAGPELTVSVLENRALPVVEIAPKQGFFDFERKYTKGMTEYFVPARIDPGLAQHVQAIALSAAQVTGCTDSCRVDVMGGGPSGPRVLEVNTIPGMTGTSLLPMAARAVGIEFPALCDRLLRRARLRNGRLVDR
jgi:D-alanine-D-alanine ligase